MWLVGGGGSLPSFPTLPLHLPVSAFNCLAPNLTLAFFSLRYESITVWTT